MFPDESFQMKVLITGSSGLIGTNAALALMDRGDEVVGIDRRANTWTDRIDTRLMDLNQATAADLPGESFDVVLQCAAHAKVFELVQQPDRAMENIRMLFNVLEYCRSSRTPIVFASSREVYGDILRHVTDESAADFVVAESPYSASKIAGEALVYSYAQCYKLPYLVFRFSNVYGRFDNDLDRMERVIPLFIWRISRGAPITVFGPKKVLDFTYIDDCVSGVIAGLDALTEGNVQCQTINLATGQGYTLLDLVNMIGMCLAKTPDATFQEARVGEVTRYVADISRARSLLRYEPRFPLTSGLIKAIQWQRETGWLKD